MHAACMMSFGSVWVAIAPACQWEIDFRYLARASKQPFKLSAYLIGHTEMRWEPNMHTFFFLRG